MLDQIRIEKVVHGGQGIGTLADGQRIFLWNTLPGELVEASLTKKRNKLAEGVAINIIEPSNRRVEPRDEAYLSTSPWQMMDYDTENLLKKEILTETLLREHVNMPADINFESGYTQWGYRNKMEYSFYGDEQGLHLALFNRGSKGKRIIEGSSIAMAEVDLAANKLVTTLEQNQIRASQLKAAVLRASQAGEVVIALFVKDANFPKINDLGALTKGLVVYYSTPKSPASVITDELYRFGDITLTDKVNGKEITYDVNSFFQVNLEIFNQTITKIVEAVGDKEYTDMYSGVGAIGLAIGGTGLLVESSEHNVRMAQHNCRDTNLKVVQATAESALEHIAGDRVLIVDPPRAGLNKSVIKRILEAHPQSVAYLSCNPITQARDLQILQEKYKLASLTGYNFFPKTPHIESLAILELKNS